MEFSAYIVLAFLILVAAEALCLRGTRHAYSLNVAISNMSCGVLSLCTNVFYAVFFAAVYMAVESRVEFLEFRSWQWWNLVLTFLIIDLCYYAYHRMSHRVSLLWGAHIAHHQSDEYNLTVSLRQGSVSLLVSTPFYLIPALIGIPLPMFLAANAVYQLYQFFVHTALVENMGWLEHVLATPRLHRTHHARNAEYIDCNYSGFLILWDKLFGSYREPSVEPVYGVTEPLSSWSPVWANFGYFQKLVAKVRSRRGWARLWTVVGPPEWLPSAETSEGRGVYVPYNAQPAAGRIWLAVTAFVVGVFLAVFVAGPAINWVSFARVIAVLCAVASAILATRLFDGEKRLSSRGPSRRESVARSAG